MVILNTSDGYESLRISTEGIMFSEVTLSYQNETEISQMSPMARSFLIVGLLFVLVLLLAIIHVYIEYIKIKRKRRTKFVESGPMVRRKSTLRKPKSRPTRTHSIIYVKGRNSKAV